MYVPYASSSDSPLAQSISVLANNAANLLANAGMTDSLYMPYEMCKSKIIIDASNSESDGDSEADSDSLYKSFAADKRRTKRSTVTAATTNNTSAVSVLLNIGQGMLTMYAPVRVSFNYHLYVPNPIN